MNISAPIETSERIEAAARLVASGRHGEGEALLRAILEREPNHPDALNTLASIALARGDAKRAYDILAPTCSAYADHPRLLSNLGLAHALLGRAEDAIVCLDRAVALAPTEPAYRLSLAQCLTGHGNVARAMTELETLLRQHPQHAPALAQLGLTLMAAGDFGRAEAALRQAVEITPDDVDSLTNLSVFCTHAGRHQEAAALAERAHLWAPLDLAKQVQLARCRAMLGEFDAAAGLCKRVLMVAADNVPATELFARIAIAQGATDSGIATLSQLVRRQAKNPDAILALAGALRFAGRLAQALTFVDQALAIAPDHAFGSQLRRDLLLALGRFDEIWKPSAARPDLQPYVVAPKGTSAVEAVLFARFIGGVARDGVHLVTDANPQMEALLRHAHGVRVPDGEIAREGQGLLLQGLPAALGLDLARGEIAPTGPYFAPNPAHVQRWQKAFANVPRPLIGVTFDEFPPGALIGMLAPIVEAVATPVSLVVGPARHQLRNWPKAIDGGVHFDDPADMIAAISCLDAVVGTDCLPLHLAGALGIPGVALAPCGYPWYFAAEADRSIWYPSLHIVRQAAPGQWAGVLERAAEALTRIVLTNKGAAIQ